MAEAVTRAPAALPPTREAEPRQGHDSAGAKSRGENDFLSKQLSLKWLKK